MDGVQEGVNTEQFAAASGVVENTAATQEGVSSEFAAGQSVEQSAGEQVQTPSAQGQQVSEQEAAEAKRPVPYDRFKEVNDGKRAAEDRVALLEQHIQLQRANPPQQQPQQQAQQSISLQVMQELGLDPTNILTGEEQARVNDIVLQRVQAANQSQLQTQSFIASKPDYGKVVGSIDPITGQFNCAPPLKRVIENNPSIAVVLRNAGANSAMLAYELASKDSQYLAEVVNAAKPQQQQNSELANKVIQQANRQSSISAVAGTGTLDRAAAIRAMSDSEFEKYKQDIMKKAT